MEKDRRLNHETSIDSLYQLYLWAQTFLGLDNPDKKPSEPMAQLSKEMYELVLSDVRTIVEIKQLTRENMTDEEFGKQVKIIFNSFDQEF